MTYNMPTKARGGGRRRDAVIGMVLAWMGRVMPRDVASAADVSDGQATRILAAWASEHPGLSEHRKNAQGYFASGEQPTDIDSTHVLAFLRGQALAEWAGKGLGMNLGVPMLDLTGQLEPPVSGDILRTVLSAIAQRKALSIRYVGRMHVSERIVSPGCLCHALGRCHVRCFDHRDEIYKDFVLSRISSVVPSEEACQLPLDRTSSEKVVLSFKLNSEASEHAKAVASTEWRLNGSERRQVATTKSMAVYVIRHTVLPSSNGVPVWVCADAKTASYERKVSS